MTERRDASLKKGPTTWSCRPMELRRALTRINPDFRLIGNSA